MLQSIGEYCNACDLCLQTKLQHCKPIGKLHPLPIPENHWDTVSVTSLANSPNHMVMMLLWVVVDSTGKHGHFIPTHTTATALGSVRLYLQHVWKTPQTSAICPVQSGPTVCVAVHA